MRASGLVSALIDPQKRRKRHLVQPDKQDEYLFEQPHVVIGKMVIGKMVIGLLVASCQALASLGGEITLATFLTLS